MSYGAKIRTKFGEFTIYFSDKTELEKKLTEVQELIQIVERRTAKFAQLELPKPIPGLEAIYTMTPDGLIKILRFPKSKRDGVRLALFLSPKPLTSEQIRQATGVDNPAAYMKTKDFISLPDGTYVLSTEGMRYVTSKIIPSLKKG